MIPCYHAHTPVLPEAVLKRLNQYMKCGSIFLHPFTCSDLVAVKSIGLR